MIKDESDYNKLKVEDLKSELKKRNIAFGSKDLKKDLINLLKQSDSSKTK